MVPKYQCRFLHFLPMIYGWRSSSYVQSTVIVTQCGIAGIAHDFWEVKNGRCIEGI